MCLRPLTLNDFFSSFDWSPQLLPLSSAASTALALDITLHRNPGGEARIRHCDNAEFHPKL